MNIEYEKRSYRSYNKEEEKVSDWIKWNLRQGGIEDKIEKLISLASLIGETYLSKNPDKLDEVVRAIDCDGLNHTLTLK